MPHLRWLLPVRRVRGDLLHDLGCLSDLVLYVCLNLHLNTEDLEYLGPAWSERALGYV